MVTSKVNGSLDPSRVSEAKIFCVSLSCAGVLSHAKEAGVSQFIVPGSTLEESEAALRVANSYPGLCFATAGVHPYSVASESLSLSETLARIETLLEEPRVVALGECGLDTSEGFPPLELQLAWFEPQVALACKIGKPLFLHERLAHDAFVEVLSKYSTQLPPTIVHCFTGDAKELEHYLEMGFFISLSGIICKEARGAPIRDLIPRIPIERLMVETDAPYLGFPGCRAGAPAGPKKQYPNLPAALPLVIKKVSQCHGNAYTLEQIASVTAKNARAFFRLPLPK